MSFPELEYSTAAFTHGRRVKVRLDEPLNVPVAAVLDVPETADRHEWREVVAPLSEAVGSRDLYLVFPTAGARVSNVHFGDG